MLVPSQQKDQKIKQIQKTERKAFWTLAVTSQCRILAKKRGKLIYAKSSVVYLVL